MTSSKDSLLHIFRDKVGHFSEDTPINRQTLLSTLDLEYYKGPDIYGNQWFIRKMDNGSQVWIQSRNCGEILKGGINITQKGWSPITGLCKTSPPSNLK